MRTRHVDGVEVHRGSGNMLADLDLAIDPALINLNF